MKTEVQLLEELVQLVRARGPNERPGMPTTHRGVELPLTMADVPPVTGNALGYGPSFQGLGEGEIDLHHYTLGEVLISCSSVKPTALFSYGLEVRVTGVEGALSDVLGIGFVANSSGPYRVLLPLGSAFQKLVIEGRQVVNGVPSGDGPDQNSNLVGAALPFHIQARIYR